MVVFSRTDFVSFELLKIMKKAGCHSVCYGIESADERILENIRKKIDLSRVPDVIRWTKKAGIEACVSFMLGNPGETEETLKKSLGYAISLKADIFIFNIITLFSGTEMFM